MVCGMFVERAVIEKVAYLEFVNMIRKAAW